MHKFKLTFVIFLMYIDVKQDSCEAVFDFFSCVIKLNPSTVSYKIIKHIF